MNLLTADEIIALTKIVVAERDELRNLLSRVTDAVLDQAPDGMSVAYLPAELLAEIRRRTG